MRLHIPEELVRRLIEDQFPDWADRTIEPLLPYGWDTCSFRLGQDLVVRLPAAARHFDLIGKEQVWLPRLAPHLPVPIPQPLATGDPGQGFPWQWSVYPWLEAKALQDARIADHTAFGRDLGRFLSALQAIPTKGMPQPSAQNYYRGASLSQHDREIRETLLLLADAFDKGGDQRISIQALARLWRTALTSRWNKPAVPVHGNLSGTTILVQEGALAAVIDFGMFATGDPACDLTVAWTDMNSEARAAFRKEQAHDPETWNRARGWAVCKAVATLRDRLEIGEPVTAADAIAVRKARQTLALCISELWETT